MTDLVQLELVLLEGLPHGIVVQGTIIGETGWHKLTVGHLGLCEHIDTICAFCAGSWHAEWQLRLLDGSILPIAA